MTAGRGERLAHPMTATLQRQQLGPAVHRGLSPGYREQDSTPSGALPSAQALGQAAGHGRDTRGLLHGAERV